MINVLAILQVIGIVLLFILAILIILILFLLFVPIKYRSNGRKDEEGVKVNATVTFSNPLLRVLISYQEELIYKVKILGITIYSNKNKKEESNKKDDISEAIEPENLRVDEKSFNKTKENIKEKDANKKEDTISIVSEKAKKKEKDSDIDKEKAKRKEKDSDIDKEKAKKKEKDSDIDKEKTNLVDTITYYMDWYNEYKNDIFKFIKQTFGTLKKFMPKTYYAKGIIGTGKPDITGKLFGGYWAIEQYLKGHVKLEPEWLESKLTGEYFLKGKIRLIHILVLAIRIIINRRYIKAFKEIEKGGK